MALSQYLVWAEKFGSLSQKMTWKELTHWSISKNKYRNGTQKIAPVDYVKPTLNMLVL